MRDSSFQEVASKFFAKYEIKIWDELKTHPKHPRPGTLWANELVKCFSLSANSEMFVDLTLTFQLVGKRTYNLTRFCHFMYFINRNDQFKRIIIFLEEVIGARSPPGRANNLFRIKDAVILLN